MSGLVRAGPVGLRLECDPDLAAQGGSLTGNLTRDAETVWQVRAAYDPP